MNATRFQSNSSCGAMPRRWRADVEEWRWGMLPGPIVALALAAGLCAAAEHAICGEIIFHNANIYTLNPDRPRAAALAVAGERIVRIGSRDEVLAGAAEGAKKIDLGGATVLPGLIDAHAHMAGLGSFALGRLDLSAARSFDEVVTAVEQRVRSAAPGEWILGGRWDHESWPDRKLPSHEALSAVSPDNPVWLTRVDGHAGLANAAAMRQAGVTRESASPAGGAILTDERGEATGVFVDNAMELIGRAAPARTDFEALVLSAQELCLAAGLTSVHDAGVSTAEIEVYRRLEADRRLKLRIYALVHGDQAVEHFARHGIHHGPRLTVRACKLYMDGAMGSRGAWLLAPYADRPTDEHGHEYCGLAVTDPSVVREIAEDAARRGYQVCTHAIGDRANREVLDVYEAVTREHGLTDHRFRIEHAQLLSPADIERFAKLGVIASMQPTHCTSDMRWVEDRVGAERARGAYAWAQLLRGGARIAAGSDFPVESHNPLLGFYAAVTRQDAEGRPAGGWRTEDRMTRDEALRAFTRDAAYAAFQEREKGALAPGMLADLTVVDRDMMTCDPRAILEAMVIRTVIGGETVYERNGG